MRDWFCFFLILALRVLFLGKGGGGERKESEHFKCSQASQTACPWMGGGGVEQGGSFILTQGGMFDFCRGGQRLCRLETIRGRM